MTSTIFRISLLATALLAATLSPAVGRTYFVAATGNDTYSGSVDSALRTIGKAVSLVHAGDIVFWDGLNLLT